VGRHWDACKYYEEWLLEVGFVDVVQKIIPWPMTAWPDNPKLKEVGRWNSRTWRTGNLSATRKFLDFSGLPKEELDQLVSDFKAELLDNRNKYFNPFFIVYGRKPFEGEVKAASMQMEHEQDR
jgi:hypothetical protein